MEAVDNSSAEDDQCMRVWYGCHPVEDHNTPSDTSSDASLDETVRRSSSELPPELYDCESEHILICDIFGGTLCLLDRHGDPALPDGELGSAAPEMYS